MCGRSGGRSAGGSGGGEATTAGTHGLQERARAWSHVRPPPLLPASHLLPSSAAAGRRTEWRQPRRWRPWPTGRRQSCVVGGRAQGVRRTSAVGGSLGEQPCSSTALKQHSVHSMRSVLTARRCRSCRRLCSRSGCLLSEAKAEQVAEAAGAAFRSGARLPAWRLLAAAAAAAARPACPACRRRTQAAEELLEQVRRREPLLVRLLKRHGRVNSCRAQHRGAQPARLVRGLSAL